MQKKKRVKNFFVDFIDSGIYSYDNKAVASFSFHIDGRIDESLYHSEHQKSREFLYIKSKNYKWILFGFRFVKMDFASLLRFIFWCFVSIWTIGLLGAVMILSCLFQTDMLWQFTMRNMNGKFWRKIYLENKNLFFNLIYERITLPKLITKQIRIEIIDFYF